MAFFETNLGKLDPRVLASVEKTFKVLPVEKYLKAIPFVKKKLEEQYDGMMDELGSSLKPYQDEFTSHAKMPSQGIARKDILGDIKTLQQRESARWESGYVSGAVYHGDASHIDFLNQVYALQSQSNPLHSDIWPSATKFEAEIVSMTANMLGASESDDDICGTVSSGGSESIMLAMKTYRDWAKATKGISKPEMVIANSAHAAFDKAAQYFGIKKVTIPVGADYRANVAAMRKAVNRNTIVIVGSTPSFPHGVVDDIAELAKIAEERGIGCHVDACLGGFILPWAQKLGYDVADFDFRVPGVTSISADTHKFGYAAKGTSVILYRTAELRHYQYYTATDWPGGLYFSPTFAGSRPGALSATCWAAMLAMGEQGYLDATQKILTAASEIKAGIAEIPELEIMGNPLWVIAFKSEQLDIYKIMDFMTERGWSLNGLHKPACVHICATLRHAEAGVVSRFLSDLQAAVNFVKTHPDQSGGMAPVYGMAGTLPAGGIVSDILKRYLDLLYRV